MEFDSLLHGLRPFNPRFDTPRDVGLGGPSTEYIATERVAGAPLPSGGPFMNIPSIWWDSHSRPYYLPPDAAVGQARAYEQDMGLQFPQYDSVGAAIEQAIMRSAIGGATREPLARYK